MIKVVTTKEHPTCAASFFWWRRIFIGTDYANIPPSQRVAVVSHEVGHVVGRHTELKLLCLLLCPLAYIFLCWWCEIQADRHSVRCGNGRRLLEFLKDEASGGLLHPSHATRRRYIKKEEKQLRKVHVKNQHSKGTA